MAAPYDLRQFRLREVGCHETYETVAIKIGVKRLCLAPNKTFALRCYVNYSESKDGFLAGKARENRPLD
jgi:hypothetical protein